MALQTSGMISLGQIHAEAGGSATGACTINDSDIRGLIGKSSGAAMNFAEWYGASALLDTQTVTVGYIAPSLYGVETRGYDQFFSVGSISDGTLNPVGNKAITVLAWLGANATGTTALNGVYLSVSGSASNSGFTTMTVGSTVFNRTSATYTAGTNTTWAWSTTSNPFGSTGSVVSVEFA